MVEALLAFGLTLLLAPVIVIGLALWTLR